jgi:hypothetical protein
LLLLQEVERLRRDGLRRPRGAVFDLVALLREARADRPGVRLGRELGRREPAQQRRVPERRRRAGREGIEEAEAGARQFVDSGSAKRAVAVAAWHPGADPVNGQQDDIGPRGRRGGFLVLRGQRRGGE